MASATIDSAALKSALEHLARAAADAEAELNAADGALGDGDLGITVAKGFAETVAASLPDDVGLAFLECAKAFQRASSSSFGTLVATGFMAAAKATKGQTELPAGEVPQLLAAAREAMMARGKGKLGDKTILDSLDAAAAELEGTPAEEMAERAVAAAEATLVEFRGRPCKLGRARMFAEKSAMLDDPGQLAFLKLARALA